MRARFFLYVVIVALIPPSLALIATSEAGSHAEREMEARAWSALSALTDKLDADAALRRETLLRIIALPEVTSLVRDSAASVTKPSADTVARVRAAVSDLFRDQTPELIAVVNQAGAQVVITSGEPKAVDVKELAPAEAALEGQMAVVYSKFDGKFYRLTAAPVGLSDAAIVLGDRLGESTVGKLKENIRADVTFALGGKPVVSSSKDATLGPKLAASRPAGTVRTGELPLSSAPFLKSVLPIWVSHEKDVSMGQSLSPVSRGQAADPGAPVAWVTVHSGLEWAGKAQVYGFGAMLVILLMGLAWIPVIYGPVHRQARSIEAHLARLRAERSLRLGTRGFSGPFAAIATLLDKLVDEWTKDAALAPPAIREGPPPTTTETPRPIIQRPPVELPLSQPPPPPPSAEVAAVAAAFPFQDDPHATSTGRQKVTKAPSKQETPPAPPPPPTPAKPDLAAQARTTTTSPRLDIRAVTPSPAIQAASADTETSGPIPLPGSAGPMRNGVTRVGPAATSAAVAKEEDTEIPPELLARSHELEQEMLGGAPAPEPEEETEEQKEEKHYQAIFEEFLTTRRKCGEPNEGLTFDKFATRLRKNRDQLVEKYKCRTVRFQVYVKDGKAAVKAVPVR